MTNQTIYVVIQEDHSAGAHVTLFSDADVAVEWAKAQVRDNNSDPEDIDEELTDFMRQAGWLYYGRYSLEGDMFRVVSETVRSSFDSSDD